MKTIRPTAEQVKTDRKISGLTQTEIADVLHTVCRVVQQWEAGSRSMHPAFRELFLRKTGQLFDS